MVVKRLDEKSGSMENQILLFTAKIPPQSSGT